ncbi:hypothetical protein OG729_20175 [Streptomyces sp. NBC_00210]|uniref:hypothetical protein n=1 Tax=Streptomyces sp. NBC_00210 TaxID=2903636 RepID=UPI003252C457
MTDIIKGVISGGWLLLVGWIFPTSINVALFSLLVLPSLQEKGWAHGITHADAIGKSLAFITVSVFVGLLGSMTKTPAYRMLEGYLLPSKLASYAIERQKTKKNDLTKKIEDVEAPAELAAITTGHGDAGPAAVGSVNQGGGKKDKKAKRAISRAKVGLWREKLDRYPGDDSQIMPTRLGNAIRRFETYGQDRYQIDAVALWYELSFSVPKELRDQIDSARANVDFFVCLLYGHVLVAVSAGATLLAADHPYALILWASMIGLLAFSYLWYLCATRMTDNWAAVIRAMINLGRKPMAESLGLKVPASLEEERKMWEYVSALVSEPYILEASQLINPFRAQKSENIEGPAR